jgi:hypothetical protein
VPSIGYVPHTARVRQIRSIHQRPRVTMLSIHIALQEGFSGDAVVIRVNGEEVFRESNVTTRLQIGLACSRKFDVEESRANVDVSVPTRNTSASITLEGSRPVYLGVSVGPQGEVLLQPSDQPFGYL